MTAEKQTKAELKRQEEVELALEQRLEREVAERSGNVEEARRQQLRKAREGQIKERAQAGWGSMDLSHGNMTVVPSGARPVVAAFPTCVRCRHPSLSLCAYPRTRRAVHGQGGVDAVGLPRHPGSLQQPAHRALTLPPSVACVSTPLLTRHPTDCRPCPSAACSTRCPRWSAWTSPATTSPTSLYAPLAVVRTPPHPPSRHAASLAGRGAGAVLPARAAAAGQLHAHLPRRARLLPRPRQA